MTGPIDQPRTTDEATWLQARQWVAANMRLVHWIADTYRIFMAADEDDLFQEATLAAFFKRTEAGGDFRMNVKLLSENTVITTGKIMPFWSFVLALNSLQNAMILTPCAPRAGPTGGAGFAAPAGSWRRT